MPTMTGDVCAAVPSLLLASCVGEGGAPSSWICSVTMPLDCIVIAVSYHGLSLCETPTHTLVVLKKPSSSLWASPVALLVFAVWPLSPRY